MAITLVADGRYPIGAFANGNSADWSGTEEVIAAPTSGSIIVYGVTISSGAAITITIGAGETGGAVTAVLIGPVYLAANATVVMNFTRPILLPATTAVVADGSGAGAATVFVEYAVVP